MIKQKSMEERVDRLERLAIEQFDKLFKLEEELKNHKQDTGAHRS